jgi:hypothetical protein
MPYDDLDEKMPLERWFKPNMKAARMLLNGEWFRRHHEPGRFRMLRWIFACDAPLRVHPPRGDVPIPNGRCTVIHPDAAFQGRTIVFHNVTLGNWFGRYDGVRIIGRDVFLGTRELGPWQRPSRRPVGDFHATNVPAQDGTVLDARNFVVTRFLFESHRARERGKGAVT